MFLLLGIASGLPCGAIMAPPTQVLAPETRSVGIGIMFTVYYGVNAGGPWSIGLIAREAECPRFAFDASAISISVAAILWFLFRQPARRSSATRRAEAVSQRPEARA
jgi:hypothetical protein